MVSLGHLVVIGLVEPLPPLPMLSLLLAFRFFGLPPTPPPAIPSTSATGMDDDDDDDGCDLIVVVFTFAASISRLFVTVAVTRGGQQERQEGKNSSTIQTWSKMSS